jgi:hypothetical protein
MPANTKDKLEFVFAMARHSNVNLHDCQRIMRYAATIRRLAETACNRELTIAEIRKDEKMQMDIIEICAPSDVTAKFNGDPRGCVVKLVVPEGICVPA